MTAFWNYTRALRLATLGRHWCDVSVWSTCVSVAVLMLLVGCLFIASFYIIVLTQEWVIKMKVKNSISRITLNSTILPLSVRTNYVRKPHVHYTRGSRMRYFEGKNVRGMLFAWQEVHSGYVAVLPCCRNKAFEICLHARAPIPHASFAEATLLSGR